MLVIPVCILLNPAPPRSGRRQSPQETAPVYTSKTNSSSSEFELEFLQELELRQDMNRVSAELPCVEVHGVGTIKRLSV